LAFSSHGVSRYADTAEITISTSNERPPREPLGSRKARASAGSAGADEGLMMDISTMYAMYAPASRNPGTMAARYMSPMDRPSWSARMISTSDGGMICDKVPEAAMTPVANRLS